MSKLLKALKNRIEIIIEDILWKTTFTHTVDIDCQPVLGSQDKVLNCTYREVHKFLGLKFYRNWATVQCKTEDEAVDVLLGAFSSMGVEDGRIVDLRKDTMATAILKEEKK